MCGLLCGCGNLPEPYAPPAQRQLFVAPPEAARLINMSDADAENHFIHDVSPELDGNTWRWTGRRPTIRLRTGTNPKLAYSMDFVIAESTLRHTGPVTLALFVNDHLLDRLRYASPGRRRIKKPIPTEWLAQDENAILAAEIDKVWTPLQPGATPVGFILVALGLEPQGKK